jgi:hypothetical protein
MSTGRNPRPGYGLIIEFHDTFLKKCFLLCFFSRLSALGEGSAYVVLKYVSYKNSLLVMVIRKFFTVGIVQKFIGKKVTCRNIVPIL